MSRLTLLPPASLSLVQASQHSVSVDLETIAETEHEDGLPPTLQTTSDLSGHPSAHYQITSDVSSPHTSHQMTSDPSNLAPGAAFDHCAGGSLELGGNGSYMQAERGDVSGVKNTNSGISAMFKHLVRLQKRMQTGNGP